MRSAFYDNAEYKQKQAEATHLNWTKGIFNHKVKELVTRSCKNPKCVNSFQIKPYNPKIFCSRSCAAMMNNLKRGTFIARNRCLSCTNLVKRGSTKYCSNQCQGNYSYKQYINQWKQGLKDGNIGINAKSMSGHIRRYLIEKYNEKCSSCGWDKKHSKTQVVPLEVNHIDGNSTNNLESNLELLCPNCHALTSNFRNLNKGNGRAWRIKYLKDSF